MLRTLKTKKSIHKYKGKIKKMAFLTKYRVDTANKVRKDMCFLRRAFFQMRRSPITGAMAIKSLSL